MSEQATVRVRFAPSPTGHLHVGGARTALFNWLYARNQKGRFILRIEDTDRERSTADSYDAILRSMKWLGLDWDEGPGVGGPCGPYLQSERLESYRDFLQRLQEVGAVYPSYCTPEEVEQRQREAQESGGMADYGRDLSDVERARLKAAGRPEAWRLRIPREGTTFWHDVVVGKREFANEVLTDRVCLKADGYPTYNFAAVVDDHLMGVTHVLRGDDHVSNTPFQLLVYSALGLKAPKFGHLPMILGPDRQRLSKRHGATSVEEFAAQGIVPDAMINYLALLGWSIGAAGDEVLTRQELIKRFSLKKVNSSPSAFDYDKLNHINAEHIKRLPPQARLALALPVLGEREWSVSAGWQLAEGTDTNAYLQRLLGTLGNRFSNLGRLPEQLAFFFHEDYPVDAEAASEHLAGNEARARLRALAEALEASLDPVVPATADRFEEVVRLTAEKLGIPAGQLIHPARVALTGQVRSAGIFEVMELIGRPRVIARLRRAADAGS
jgi:glutamyl-tRNA synthetase